MAVMQPGAFADLLDPRFREIVGDVFAKQHEDMVPVFWSMPGATTPMRDTERYSEVSGVTPAGQFTGVLDYASFFQGYDTIATYSEWGQGLQINRTLVEWDQKNIIEERPKVLARSFMRRRQIEAHRWLRNAFSVDTFYHNRTEGVALCANLHTTTTGAATTAGFDNLATTPFAAASLATLQIQMADFRDLQAQPIALWGDTIIYPIDLYAEVYEAVASQGKVDQATNNRNVHYGAYTMIALRNKVDFPDVNDWFFADGTLMKDHMLWFDQVWPGGQPEFGFTEDFDTFNAKYRGYSRWTNLIRDWRFLVGAQVS